MNRKMCDYDNKKHIMYIQFKVFSVFLDFIDFNFNSIMLYFLSWCKIQKCIKNTIAFNTQCVLVHKTDRKRKYPFWRMSEFI